jgi:hypothetical protein
MAIINKGKSFANGEQLTADKLNQVIDNATFTTSAVDNVSTQLSSGAIIVKDGGVTTAKLNDGAVTTAKVADSSVTTAKIADANVTFAKLTDVIDDDTMATASNTKLATSESIKAYVDGGGGFTPSTYAGEESVTLPNGLIMKTGFFSDETGGEGKVVDYGSAFPNATISVQLTQVGGTTNSTVNLRVMTSSASGFTMYVNDGSGVLGSFWTAIGY